MTEATQIDAFVDDVVTSAEAKRATARGAAKALASHFEDNALLDEPGKTLRELAEAMGLPICDCSCMIDCEVPLACEPREIDEALARAQRGQIDDALVHLGRALPASHAALADLIARYIRSRP